MKKIGSILSALALLVFLLLGSSAFAQKKTEQINIEPPFWWIGMQNTELQLMVRGKNIGETRVQLKAEGVKLERVSAVENPNYLFLDLSVSESAKAGFFEISFLKSGKVIHTVNYELKVRKQGSALRQGFTSADAIYLLMPDRFANGDPANDNIPGMLENADRKNPDGRHGGDLEGIIQHLDYFNELGVTALWLNPVLENNMPANSYHGYAITDFYQVDPRLGGNEKYLELVEKAHKKDLKIIMDMVFNHYGTAHKWTNDLPMSDWVNQWPEFTRSNYRGGTLTDPYAAAADQDKMLRGWFDVTMADLNQRNPFVANYLIQNSIWWIEYGDLNGIRMDTYPYSFKEFMQEWMQRIRTEYPDFSVVGEVWLNSGPMVAYWHDQKHNFDGFNSHLNYVMDFPLKSAISRAFNEANGWSSGVNALYESLSMDFVYGDPNTIMNFLDNHDMDRIATTLGEDIKKQKMAATFLLTVRGVPQLYYGNELGTPGVEHKGHGQMRNDFSGGWPDDNKNAFTSEGRSPDENELWNHFRTLLHYRKNTTALQNGKMTHYIPEDGVYVYFRSDEKQTIMIVLNNNNQEKTIKTARFAENLKGFDNGTDLLHRTWFEQLDEISIPAMDSRVIELKQNK
ncbi:MAG: glycoside hydrolase family 13 protein [Bacteroidales bacterium]|jgi:glycosidase|nr:glycoside hydrolase family 13 protein [Bacteroidales bacterium]